MPKRPADSVTVLFIDPVADMGGAQVVLRDIIERLDRSRFTPVLACLRPGPFVEEARRLGVTAYGLRPHRTRHLHRLMWSCAVLGAIARRHDVGIVHANLGNGLLYGWAAARGSGARLVWHAHDPHQTDDLFGRFFAKVQARLRPDWTIFATTTVGASYEEVYPRLGRRSTVFGGVDAGSNLPGVGRRARERLGIPLDAPIVLSLSRLQRFKGQHLLLDAFARLLVAHPSAHLVVAGGTLFGREPEYARELADRAGHPDLAGRVHLVGFVSEAEKHDLLDACNVLAHPAVVEPLGIAVLEAMAHGRPVVAFDAAGPAHTVAHGVTGLLIPRGDRDQLTSALTELLKEPERARVMGFAGRNRAAERFSVERSVTEVRDIYEQVLEGR